MVHTILSVLPFLGLPTALAAGFYGKNSPVLEIDGTTYQSLIANSNYTSIVEFYAPWCGHCQSLKPAYTKAAESLAGLAKVAAVNCDEEINKPFCGQMGIQGFPTLKIVKRGEKGKRPIVTDYKGARTAKAIVDELITVIPNKVKTLKDKDVSAWLASNDKPKAILFSDKGVVKPMLKALAIDFLDVLDFAQVRNTETEAVKTYSITKYPSLVLLPVNNAAPVPYDGEMKKAAIIKFLAQSASPNPDPAPRAAKPKKAASDKSQAFKASSTFKAASKSAKSASAKASQTEEVLEDVGMPTESPSPEVDTPKPVDLPVAMPPKPLGVLRETTELQRACLNNKASMCLLLLQPKDSAPSFEKAEAVVGELRANGEKAGRPLFPSYRLAEDGAASAEIYDKLSLDKTQSHLIVLNAKRGWYTTKSAAAYTVSDLQNWVSAIRLGDVEKSKLSKDLVVEASDLPPPPEPEKKDGFEEAMEALRDLHDGGFSTDGLQDISDEDFQRIITGAKAADEKEAPIHEEL